MSKIGSEQIVLSGIRATGRMHLGNYLGVLERFAALSKDKTKRCYYFIADMHTLTTLKDAERIRQSAPNIAMDMLAAGVDPESAILYPQSFVSGPIAALAWYLACLTSHGDLERIPTFKDKAEKQPHDVNAGLYLYPVLMAADILGVHADLVPVGKDQEAHLELARELARRFNRVSGMASYFPIPDAMKDEMVSVPGLVAMDAKDQFAKMGKSELARETLYLDESPAQHREKLRKAPTDPARVRREDPGTPAKCAIFQLHTLASSDERMRWSAEGCRSASISCRDCKDALADSIEERLREFRERRAAIATDPNRVQEILRAGAKRAEAVLQPTADFVAEALGLPKRPPNFWP